MHEELMEMAIDLFAFQGQPIEIKVPWAHQTLWWVPGDDDANAFLAEGVIRGRIWTGLELVDLFSIPELTRPQIRAIAMAKLIMDGDIEAVSDRRRAPVEPESATKPTMREWRKQPWAKK